MAPRAAWALCDEPGGERGIQNIRKRGYAARSAMKPVDSPAVEVTAVAETPPSDGVERQRNKEVFRLNSEQVRKQWERERELKEAFDKIYVEATETWASMVAAGQNGKGESSADAVAARFQAQLPAGCKRKLTGRSLKHALSQGRIGRAPRPRNNASALPASFVESVSQYAQLKQLNGDEQKPRQLVQAALASAKGTAHEARLHTQSQKQYLLKRVRREMEIGVATSKVIDDRRWMWLTSTNLSTWMRGYMQSLAEWKYIPGMPDNIFEVIVIPENKLPYMANGDESHQKLSNEGDSSGTRANVYINHSLARAGKRKVTYQKHATIWVWANYAGEAGPVALMLATDSAEAKAAKCAAGSSAEHAQASAPATSEYANRGGIRVRPEWMCGVPRVYGKFGHPERKVFDPTFLLNESGGTTGDGLEELFELGVLPCYPNLSPTWVHDETGNIVKGPLHFQLDAGPGRYAESTLAWRASMWERGAVLFPGLLNGTTGNQVLDDLFGLYKGSCADVIDSIISERITANQNDSSVKVNLDFSDLGRIINGRPDDPIEFRPFERAFTADRIKSSCAKLGVAPVDLNRALSHPRVRDDNLDGVRSNHVTDLIHNNEANLEAISAAGFNASALTVPLVKDPSQAVRMVAPPADWEDRWKAVKAAGGSASAHWVAVGPRAFNAPDVVLPAMERVQEKIDAKNARDQEKEETLRELQEQAREIVDACEWQFDELTASDAKAVVSFVFKAKKLKGVGQHTGNKQLAIDYLLNMEDTELEKLLGEEFSTSDPTLPALALEPLLQLTDESTPHAPRFDSDLLPEGMLPEAATDWLPDALLPGSESATQLVGKHILYHWPTRLGGWLHGKVIGVNKDKKQVCSGVMCNFIGFYNSDGETAHHLLRIERYAKSCKSPADSWVLLQGSAVAS